MASKLLPFVSGTKRITKMTPIKHTKENMPSVPCIPNCSINGDNV